MRRWSAFALLFALSCSRPIPPPGPPNPPPVIVAAWHVYVHNIVDMSPIVDAQVYFNGTPQHTNADGYAAKLLPLGINGIVVKAEHYGTQSVDIDLQQSTETLVNLVPDAPPAPPTPRIFAKGTAFYADGQPWRADSVTAFELFHMFLDGHTADMSNFIDSFQRANTFRVFGMWNHSPTGRQFSWTNYGDRYFVGLRDFAAWMQRRGKYVEFTAITDGQDLFGGNRTIAQRAYLDRVGQALQGVPNVFLELCNEPFKNGCDVQAIGRVPGAGLQASGVYGGSSPFRLDYMTWHPERDNQWPRKTRADEPAHTFHMPVWIDEPMGAAEVSIPGRRSNVPEDFFDFAAGCALHSSGCTFHSEAGLTASVPGPVQARARDAFFEALGNIPPEVSQWHYTRGGLSDNPLQHSDALTLRTFCQVSGGAAVCQAVRPRADWQAVPRLGWRIVRQVGPNGRLVFLER